MTVHHFRWMDIWMVPVQSISRFSFSARIGKEIPASQLKPIFVEAARQGTGTKYGFVICFALILYDNVTTFAEEVELVWKRKFTAVTFFFIMNRYYSVAALCIGIFENIIPAFTPTICKRMILFQPLAAGIPLTFSPNCVVALRIYALYDRNKYLATIIIAYLLAELAVALWVYLTPSMYPVQLPGAESITNSLPLHGCLAYNSPRLSNLQAATFQFMQTVFDSWILALVLCKSAKEFMSPSSYRGLRFIIASHGLVYYMVVFTANLAWALMVLFAPTDLKYSMAFPTLALAPLAANKLTLSLRGYGTIAKAPAAPLEKLADQDGARPLVKRRESWLGTSTFELQTCTVADIEVLTK